MTKRLWCALAVPGILAAAEKALPRGEGADKIVRIEATAYLDKASIVKATGEGMPDGVVVVEVKLTPAGGQKVDVRLDDFLLRSDRDGQKSTPYSPSQVAGTSVLVVKTTYSGGAIQSEDRGPAWGGLGGGMPRRLPGSGSGLGNSASTQEAVAAIEDGGKQKESPLLAILKKKILAEQETTTPVEGQLYFLMDGKHKVKDIELLYKTTAGRVPVRFK